MKKSEFTKFLKEEISKQVTFNKKLKENNFRKSNQNRLLEIFSKNLNEDVVPNDYSADALKKIQTNSFEKPNPKSFYNALNKSKHKEMLTDYSVEDLSKMKLFKLNSYNIGYALKQWKDGTYSEIVAVFNNEPTVKGIGKELVKSAIRNGGKHLDHFDGYLSQLYQSLGFEETGRDKFDPQYDEDGSFRKKYGEADVVYRSHKGNN